MSLWEEVESYLESGGGLSRVLPSYESRPQQLAMARAASNALTKGSSLMVEAGTGTGKSLAYLIPAALWAMRNNKKVVISTYTKTLQEQILNHDLPLLRDKFKLPLRFSLCMGHENYLSLRRMGRATQMGLYSRDEEERQLREIFNWAQTTQTGMKNELPFTARPAVWEEVGRQKDLCLGKNCESYNSCFYFKERKLWYGSHLLIVNHHLFFANVASNGGVLPRFDAVIFDEAQNVEEAATSFLGLEISNSGLGYYLDRLYNARTKRGLLSRLNHPVPLHVFRQVARARSAADNLFVQLIERYGRQDRVVRFYSPPPIENILDAPLGDLHKMLKSMEAQVESDEEKVEVTNAANRCFEFQNAASAFLKQGLADYVYWLEIAARKRGPRAALCGAPINVAKELKEQVFGKIERTVLTSATLATTKGFDFIKSRTGYEPDEELILDAPFDYKNQALIYLASDLPEPTEDAKVYLEAIANRTMELIQAAGGRTFVLFTSYEMLNAVHAKLEARNPGYPFLRQGDLPTNLMIERFKEKPSVIFGTNSFWQGVDVPGEALSGVIVVKLPFDAPTEPLTEARLEDMRRRSINPFQHYQIPRAIVQLRQGFGRLIRKATDSGVVSILDSRMSKRAYGKQFLNALPPCPTTENLEDVREFFAASVPLDPIVGAGEAPGPTEVVPGGK